MTVILGIDPGSRVTGYGLIRVIGNRFECLAYGCIRAESSDLAQKLWRIREEIEEVLKSHHPEEVAIERVFLSYNPATAIKLGQARGAVISSVGEFALPLAEYSARQVKQAIVSYGAATKEQMQAMIVRILNLKTTPPNDAADALGIAICHAHHRTSQVEGLQGRRRKKRWRM